MNAGIDQHNALEGGQDIAELRRIRLQELTTGGHIEEEVLDLEVTAYRTGGWFLAHHLRTGHQQAGAYLIFPTACQQFDMGDGSNRRQGLTTEAHRMEGKEIVGLTDLRGGMALERKTGIGL